MTFTWLGTLATDTDLLRFHTGDTDSGGYWLTDELCAALVTQYGSVNAAVIAALKYIIGQLSRPDFSADWLSVSHETARKGYEALLREKRREFGVPAVVAESVMTYRHDSLQTSEVDYDADGTADN